VVTRLTVSLDREMRGVVFPSFFDFGSKFCVTNLQHCNFFFTYLIKLDLPHSLITKSVKVITKNMHKTLCVAQNIGSLIWGRQYIIDIALFYTVHTLLCIRSKPYEFVVGLIRSNELEIKKRVKEMEFGIM